MKFVRFVLWFSALFMAAPVLRAEIVINEITYHPSSENVLEEYIELHNTAGTNVNLSGWTIRRGVDFTFPANTVIAANGYLVIAAHTQTLMLKYPGVDNVVGNWAGVLSNSRNTIELRDAEGNEVDEVTYADEGDWAMRQRGPVDSNHRGWRWFAEADGGGKSLELINPAMPNEFGQNWAASRPLQGTPGRANSVRWNNGAPLVLNVQHAPVVPRSGETVSVTARVIDESTSGLSVQLFHRVDSPAPGAFAAVPMFDDGAHSDGLADDGVFGANLPGRANNTVVEFFVEAADSTGNIRTFPGPANVELFRVGAQQDAVKNWPAGRLITTVENLKIIDAVVSTPPPTNAPVKVTATIINRRSDPMPVTVYYRNSLFSAYNSAPLFDDGEHDDGVSEDGVYAGTIPGFPSGSIVDAYIEADDGIGGFCIWRPGRMGANLLYQVDDDPENTFGGTSSMQSVYKMTMTELERAELASIPTSSATRNSDAQMNATFTSLDGTGTEVRYLIGARNRGHGSRGANPPNYRVNFRSDDPWKDVTAVNLNTRQVHIQHFGSVLALKSGAAGAYSRAVQVRVNNTDLATSGAPMFGSYAANEALNSDWAELHFPFDGNGNIYRAIRDIQPPTFNYRGEDANAYRNTYFKESNVSEDDWRDLINMLRIMGTNDLFNTVNVRSVVNVEQWMTHLAVMNLFANSETGLNSGYNDDYFMYRGVNDPRFILMYYDLDQILGQGGSFGTTADIFSATFNNGSGAAFSQFMRWPAFEPIYYQTLQRLLDTTFSQTGFDALVDQTLGGYVTTATITALKTWMNGRRAYVQSVISGFVQPTPNIATISGEPRSPTPLRSATLMVGGENISSYRYRLNSGSYGPETSVATPIQLSSLPSGSSNIVSVIGRNVDGVWQSIDAPTMSKPWLIDTRISPVRLNEVLARNDSAVDHEGTFPDMIELFNEGTASVDLGGMQLSDDPAIPNKFVFPPNTLLAPGAYLVAYANDPDQTSGFHLGFGLDQNGEGLHLFDSGGTLLDSVAFGAQLADAGIGRVGNSGTWVLTRPTFPGANTPVLTGNRRALRINEWLASGLNPFADDYVELFNADSRPLDLGGLYLTDQPIGAPHLSQIHPLTFIAGGGHAAFTADGTAGQAGRVDFQLSSEFGEIALFSADLGILDSVSYGPQRTDVAQGRCPSGGISIRAQLLATPGLANACPPAPVQPQLVPLITGQYDWRYYDFGNDPGPDWMMDGYDDSFWPAGRTIIANETCGCLPEPINTQLFQTNPRQITFYFRTTFTLPANTTFTSLQLEHAIDDGAIFYLNGQEILRSGMPSGPVTHTTFSSVRVADAAYSGAINIPLSYLRPGVNLMAAELHNESLNNGDTVFGMKLSGAIVTNSPSAAGIVLNELLADNASLAEPDGTTPDWAELYNPSDTAVDLADMSLTDDLAQPRRWVFPTPSIIPGRGYFTVRLDGDLPLSATNAGFGLNASSDSLYLFDTAANGAAVLDSISFGIQAADFSIGRVPDGASNWGLTIPKIGAANLAATLGDVTQLKINEWMADPASGDDWFEVFNPGAQPVSIALCYFTDELGNLTKSRVPALSFLGAGTNAWHRFEADNNVAAGANHVNFALRAGGEALAISTTNGVLIDGVTFGQQLIGVSQGRLPDGDATIRSFTSTDSPGDPNFTIMTEVVVNEVLTHTDYPLEDAIELHNTTAAPLDVSGWWLSDAKRVLRKYQLPANTILPANGFRVIYENEFNNGDLAPIPFSLNGAEGDQIYVSATTAGLLTGLRSLAEFGAAENGVSFGRYVNSVGLIDYPAMSRRSFGRDNAVTIQDFRSGSGASNAYPKVGPIVISEIMYHPPDIDTNDNVLHEFVELHNPNASAVALYDPVRPTNTWCLRDAVDFNFPPGISIAPGGYLLVVSFDPATNAAARTSFQAQYGADAALYGPYDGKLDNSDENVELYKPDAPNPGGDVPYILVERVHYADTAPWPLSPDGFGHSLQRISTAAYANDPAAWTSAAPTPGPSGALDSDSDGMPNDWEIRYNFPTDNASNANQDADGDTFSNLQEYRAGTDPRDPASYLRITSIAAVPSAGLIEFNASAGITYSILFRPEVESGPWTKLIDIPAQSANQTMQVFDPAGDATRFYRLVTPSVP